MSITLSGMYVIGEPLTLNNKFLIKIFTRTSRKCLRLNLSFDLCRHSRISFTLSRNHNICVAGLMLFLHVFCDIEMISDI